MDNLFFENLMVFIIQFLTKKNALVKHKNKNNMIKMERINYK
jgi:hypothetical protein